jgi:hypothetical protein
MLEPVRISLRIPGTASMPELIKLIQDVDVVFPRLQAEGYL